MKPGIREEDLLLSIWDACDNSERRQTVFRAMLQRGLIAMLEAGDMPEGLVEKCDLDLILERRRRRKRERPQEAAAVEPQWTQAREYRPEPVAPQQYHPQQYQPRPAEYQPQYHEQRPAAPAGEPYYAPQPARHEMPPPAAVEQPAPPLARPASEQVSVVETKRAEAPAVTPPAEGPAKRPAQGRKLGDLM